MFFKKFFVTFISLFIMPISILAYSDYIIAGGENVGITINSKGIMVVGLYEVNGKYIAQDSGIKIGDIITKVNNKKVSSINEMTKLIESAQNKIEVELIRDDKTITTNLNLIKENEVTKTGLYVKDSIKGIGTLTFIDPNTKKFGALGHQMLNWR